MKNIFTRLKNIQIYKITGVLLCFIYVLTIALFFFTQYSYHGGSYYMYSDFSGLDLVFGLSIEGGRAGFPLFFLPVMLSIIGIICTVFAICIKSKMICRILFCTCMIISLISASIYLTTYFYEMSRYGELKYLVKWTSAFWGAFILYWLALLVSLASIIFSCKNKNIKNIE